ncbi:hypothetical protein OAD67_02805 [bacterium]|nr:hypothetical protein [bacterium]
MFALTVTPLCVAAAARASVEKPKGTRMASGKHVGPASRKSSIGGVAMGRARAGREARSVRSAATEGTRS